MDTVLSTSKSGGATTFLLLLFGITMAALYGLYRAILPKPIEGIPYNHDAVQKLFGDVPEMMAYILRTKRIFCWLSALNERHSSPIVQVFVKPMSPPWIVLTDPLEVQDILLRRTREFDRSRFVGDLIDGILPQQQLHFLSTDHRFKRNRALVNHLMGPTFISTVSAPEVYHAAISMVEVWELKCDLAAGRPFAAHADITALGLDSIFASSFGLEETESNMFLRLGALQHSSSSGSAIIDTPMPFPEEAPVPAIFSAILTLADSVTNSQLSPAPRLTSWVVRKLPYMRHAMAIKDSYIADRTAEYIALIESKDSTTPRSALHSVLLRERDLAAREGRRPDYHSRAIADEFFGFMTAGYDTSATTVSWGVKLLADHPEAQSRLRADLRAAVPAAAAAQGRAPTHAELDAAFRTTPYLDALVDEVQRHANTIAMVVRQAQVDTTVLGRRIPRGTEVFMPATGAGYKTPNMPVRDHERKPGARRAEGKALTGTWDDADIAVFRPERWLKRDAAENGAEVYDPMAGPQLAFGLGPRSCFGKRLAVQALKIQFALIVWHFELLRCPASLSGYEGVQRFALEPVQCYVRLARASS
ncbi:cytochrome P450 monooxygenase [Cryphonectria parasitica EP155]|uniref:Cytochrome P450 monooxygenase n=1 Tax=Cryphonectria parasitica (strain ATCC 38755 / EP155) TaxID=660469 RepID=A0A9P5CSZ2_CRYP1|nr:cytochrome P450 monooxygenase [Cryphonectria parasitica EP155]KAF3768620.1 cytochrome P450 monooxygenase [Cryphonectria parasitica EP155]